MSESRWDLESKWAWRGSRDQITQGIIYQVKEICPKGNHRIGLSWGVMGSGLHFERKSLATV